MFISNYPSAKKLINISIFVTAIFSAALLSFGFQAEQDLLSFFKDRSIPVTTVESDGMTIVARLEITSAYDLDPAKLAEHNSLVFVKLAEGYPESEVLRLEYFMESEVLNILEIDTNTVREYIGVGLDSADMLAHARIAVPDTMQQRIDSELNALQTRETASEPAAELTLPERTTELPDEEALSLGDSGGGGGGGGMAKASGSQGDLILLFAMLFACLAMAYAVLWARNRGRSPAVKVRAKLKIIFPDGTSQFFTVNESNISIGRDNSNSLVLDDSLVSGKHAELFVAGGSFFLRDLQSSNGTRLNGRNISQSPIYLGDELSIGNTKLIFSD